MKRLLALLITAAFWTTLLPTAPAQETGSAATEPSRAITSLALSLYHSQRSKLMYLVNFADAATLADLPSIGKVRAKAIMDARPFTAPLDLLRVPGIGEATLTEILHHARAGFPKPRAKRKR